MFNGLESSAVLSATVTIAVADITVEDRIKTILILSLVLEVGFTSGRFVGSELSGYIEVTVRITGGSSSTPITVTVTPSVQSPVSAIGT